MKGYQDSLYTEQFVMFEVETQNSKKIEWSFKKLERKEQQQHQNGQQIKIVEK